MHKCEFICTRPIPGTQPDFDEGQKRARLFQTPLERWTRAKPSPSVYPVPFPYPRKHRRW